MKEELSEDTDLRRKALQMAGIGILLFGMVCSGCDRKAQVNAEPESSEKIEYAVTETEEVSTETKKLVIEDLDDAYEALLDSCSKEFIGDYRIDESFLNWVYANYGKEDVADTKGLPEAHAHFKVGNEMLEECERIKSQLPISRKNRPAYDVAVLCENTAGEIRIDTSLGKRIYLEKDEFYNPAPMFSICAVKQ